MEDDAKRGAPTRDDPTETVANLDPVGPFRALDRTLATREHETLTAQERDRLSSRLHSRTLFSEQQLASFEVLAGRRKQDDDLHGECELAVAILV